MIVNWEEKVDEMLEEKIRDMLVNVTLYQLGLYPEDKLNDELNRFLKEAENLLCLALRRTGAICFRDYLREYPRFKAERLCLSDAWNWERTGTKGAKLIANLIRLSIEIHNPELKSIKDKILLFDKVIHAEHYSGAFKDEFTPEQVSIFRVNIPKIKQEADQIVEETLKRKR
jgi:hypothetical protein